MALKTAQHIPTATYRFQLHGGFPFSEVERLAPYLEALGISDCYFSPIFRATPGSTHGYDVSDLTLINPELGGEDGFTALIGALRARNMGCLLDFVPNHMGIAGPFNHWWLDVLENGQQSRYARYFDIEWHPRHPQLQDRILVPMLGDYYGRILEEGKLRLDYAEGKFFIRYFESRFPIRPESTLRLLDALAATGKFPDPAGRLERVRSFFQILPEPTPEAPLSDFEEREKLLRRAQSEFATLTAEPPIAEALRSVLESMNGKVGEPATFDQLHILLEEQHYRVAFWKTGAHETNYRRFFAIDTLVGLRVEDPIVLRASHAKLIELVRAGLVRAIRLDHIDGLWDPAAYLHDFQTLCSQADQSESAQPLYVLVEKIVEQGEEPPHEWPIHGTTGYEFISQLSGLLIDAKAEARFSEIFHRFTGLSTSAADTIYEKKRFVLEELFANSIGNLALGLDQIVEYDRSWRDLTNHELRVAVRETLASLSVYRTYRRRGMAATEQDAAVLHAACEEAKHRNRCLDPVPFEFVRDALLGKYRETETARAQGKTIDNWTLKFQQATGAVMAKSVEDTAFYVYNRLFALNEVGCDPGHFGAPVEEFHALNQERLRSFPQAMLTTSTHDTKMSEDVRARLYALSEQPDAWQQSLEAWSAHNRSLKTEIDGLIAPDANEEFLFYQMLLGAWPLGATEATPEFLERLRSTVSKAIREAKSNTNWIYPNERWLTAVDDFVVKALDPAHGFLEKFLPVVKSLSAHGMVNSLTQVVLKLTCPGMPDLYQGNEVWDFSLVDPDNRRPIDFNARKQLLENLDQRPPSDLLTHWEDGAIKLHVTRALLRFRRDHPMLFQQGDYTPVFAEGPSAEHVVAFTRHFEAETLLIVVPRLAQKIGIPPIGAKWGETRLNFDFSVEVDSLLNRKLISAGKNPRVADLLAELPCAVFSFKTSK